MEYTSTPGAIDWQRRTIGRVTQMGPVARAREILSRPPATGDGSARAWARRVLDAERTDTK